MQLEILDTRKTSTVYSEPLFFFLPELYEIKIKCLVSVPILVLLSFVTCLFFYFLCLFDFIFCQKLLSKKSETLVDFA
jgi:hypothetical protein